MGPKCGWLTCHTAKSRCSYRTGAQSVVQYIYKLEPQRLFARVCTLHTLAALHIYTRWRLSVHLLWFAIFTVSHPLFTRSKQDCVGLLSLSPPSQLVKEASVSRRTGKARRCSVHSIAFDEGGNPLPAVLFSFTQRLCGRATDPFFLAVVRSVGRSGLPPHALPRPDDTKV